MALLETVKRIRRDALFDAAEIACSFGAAPATLPIARGRSGWLDSSAIERYVSDLDSVSLVDEGNLPLRQDDDEPLLKLDDDVLAVSAFTRWKNCGSPALALDLESIIGDRATDYSLVLCAVILAVARGWGVHSAELLRASNFDPDTWREIGSRWRKRIDASVVATLRRP